MNNYQAMIGFLSGPGEEKGREIYYAAPDDREAVLSAFRWAKNRHEVFPEAFGKPLNIRVYRFDPRTIDINGGYTLPNGVSIYEWKCDTGERGSVKVDAPASMFGHKGSLP